MFGVLVTYFAVFLGLVRYLELGVYHGIEELIC